MVAGLDPGRASLYRGVPPEPEAPAEIAWRRASWKLRINREAK
jgi:hypothetical protein